MLVLLALIILPAFGSSRAEAQGQLCFPGKVSDCLSGRFLDFWSSNGGLAVFGYPIGRAAEMPNRDTGQTYLTQHLERNRFEYHPENAGPYDVLLGRLGDERLLQLGRNWQSEPRERGPQAGCLWFEQTGHNVCDQSGGGLGFKSYWQSHGLADSRLDSYGRSLALFGLPLTEPKMETNSSGDTVLTQWFERARFEFHPNNPDAYKVLLGLLGSEIAANQQPANIGSQPDSLAELNGTLYFAADDPRYGRELFRSDGTAAGTALVKDGMPGAGGSNPFLLTNVNGTLYFMASGAGTGYELWKSDGTAAGTVLVKDIYPGLGESLPHDFTSLNGLVYFFANDGVNGEELWRTDGTPAGTTLVKDIMPGPVGSTPPPSGEISTLNELTSMNGMLFFVANGIDGIGLWKSDGSTAGTQPLIGEGFTALHDLEVVGSTLYFVSRDLDGGRQLWRSDGTTNGVVASTFVVKDFGLGARVAHLTEVSGALFFAAFDPRYGVELWRSDGTAMGTAQVRDINPGVYSSEPFGLTNVDGVLFFVASDGQIGRGLWRTDGTSAGTIFFGYVDLLLVNPPLAKIPHLKGTVYFMTGSAEQGFALWKCDGTPGGMSRIMELPGNAYQQPYTPIVANGALFFAYDDGLHGSELWKSNGTQPGTGIVRDIGS
jgi:ELWxxDGT repeat protein